jgi:hypothetical protein
MVPSSTHAPLAERPSHKRLEIIKRRLATPTKIQGSHECIWCNEDPTLSTIVYEGHVELVTHLVNSLKSSDWMINGSKYPSNGVHTYAAKNRREHTKYVDLPKENPSCSWCGHTWKKISKRGYETHIAKKNHLPCNLSQDQAYQKIENYLLQLHGVVFSRDQFEKLLAPRVHKKSPA